VQVISADIKLDKGTPAALRKSAGAITKDGGYCNSFQHIWDVFIPLISCEVTLKKIKLGKEDKKTLMQFKKAAPSHWDWVYF